MAALLLLPFFLIRFGLLALLDSGAVGRAAHFPPMVGGEKTAYWLYQLSNAALLLTLFFLRIEWKPDCVLVTGSVVYLAGILLLLFSIIGFAHPSKNGFHRQGLYRVSRNPMYLAYFVYFLGCALLTRSVLLLGILLVFQVTAHWMILAEERWCAESFGDAYLQYKKQVRRYF